MSHGSTGRAWLLAATVLVVVPSPLLANNPPAPQIMFAEIVLLPMMAALTLAAGGYPVLRSRGFKRRRLGILLAVVAIILSGVHEAAGLLVTLAFTAVAVRRGIKLFVLGFPRVRAAASPDGPPPLSRGHSIRLQTLGILTVLLSLLLGGAGFVFIGWYGSGAVYEEKELKELVRYQLAFGEAQRAATGQARYEAPFSTADRLELSGWKSLWLVPAGAARGSLPGPSFRTELVLGPGQRTFEVWLWPTRLVPFPYNWLTSVPSFYADQTGQLRMIRVHRAGQRCPPDAPVYFKVTGPPERP